MICWLMFEGQSNNQDSNDNRVDVGVVLVGANEVLNSPSL